MKKRAQGSLNNKKVLIALSGGIDSAVSAYLLQKQGYEVEAAFMKNWSSTKGLKYDECPWLNDRQDALRVAAFLKIPLHTLDFEKEYSKKVLNYFFKEYKAGHTPNPDVMCNKEIKFKLLYNWAMNKGFDYMSTGHYARIAQVKSRKYKVESIKDKKTFLLSTLTFNLKRSADEFKDQTYFIYNIQTSQLPHLLFPIGDMLKKDVRKLAKKIGLPNADKKESMGLCFVGKIRLKDFLEQKLKPNRGLIRTTKGQVIGEHEGLYYYTLGQRQGIGVGGKDGPWYVVKKSPVDNLLVVTNNPNDPLLKAKDIEIHSVNWITEPEHYPVKLKARFRHQGELQNITLSPILKNKKSIGYYKVRFAKSQQAVASGQSLVLYDQDLCLGGGVIV